MLKTYSEETIIQVGVLETKWEFSRRSQLIVDKKHWHGWPTQVSRESRSGIESTSSKRCSWSETFPRANQLLQRVHAKPVNSSTSPDTTFGEESSAAFHKVKEMITSEQVLTHYDPSLPLKLACDASRIGIGPVLPHVIRHGTKRPIAFASRALIIKTEQIYAQIQ